MALVDATPATFQDSILASFTTLWAGRTPIAHVNLPFDPDTAFSPKTNDDAYVRISFLNDSDGEQNRGSSIFERRGVVTVQIYARAGQGSDVIQAHVDAVLGFMELNSADVKDGYINRPRVIEIGSNGTWFEIDVTASWVYFTSR